MTRGSLVGKECFRGRNPDLGSVPAVAGGQPLHPLGRQGGEAQVARAGEAPTRPLELARGRGQRRVRFARGVALDGLEQGRGQGFEMNRAFALADRDLPLAGVRARGADDRGTG